jgi:4-amino-4-deoxy-L-arabinose transferase-like glycosyltransferase
LILVGAWLISRPALGAQPLARWELAALLALTLAALLIRAIQIDQIPFPVHGDEGEMGQEARSLLRGTRANPFGTLWLDHPSLWFYIQALGLAVFGNTLGGLRLVSALIGAAAIPACYGFAREAFGRRVALTAVILLTGYQLHLHFSRVALNNIADPLMAMLTFGAFLRAWRTGSYAAFAAAGVSAGLAQYFYMGSRLTLAMLVALIPFLAAMDLPRLRARWRGLALMGVALLAGFGPLLRFFIENPVKFMARIDAQGLFQTGRAANRLAEGWTLPGLLGDQGWRAIGAYFFRFDTGQFYSMERPLLNPLEAGLLLCGFAVAIWRWRNPAYQLLIAWIVAAAIVGGALLIDPPQPMRYVIATPAICILIALGIEQLGQILERLAGIPQRTRAAAGLLAATLLAAAGLRSYFTEYTPRQRYGGTRDLTAIAYYMRSQAPDRYTYFLGPPYAFVEHGTIAFLTSGAPAENVVEPITSTAQVPAPAPGLHPVYIALHPRVDELELVRARYPGGQIMMVPDPAEELSPLYAIYEPPATPP